MNSIKTQVMGAVAVIHAVRAVLSLTALKIYAIVLSVWGIGRLVWVSKVVENFFTVQKAGISASANYFLAAFQHTHFGVQVMLLIAACALVSLLVDAVRIPAAARFAA